MNNVMILFGAGQIGLAIARRTGSGKSIIIADKKRGVRRRGRLRHAERRLQRHGGRGGSLLPRLRARAARQGAATRPGDHAWNAAGVSPSQASVETILAVDLYGTAMLLEETGKIIAPGGAGVTISSQSGHRLPALGADVDEALALTPADKLLELDVLRPENIRDLCTPISSPSAAM